jgi:hypothetical protein
MSDGEVDEAAEALYGVPLSAFTAERKRLADQLKAAGSKASAATVGKLAKPSMSAWAVNILWREDRKDMDALLEAGARVRDGDRGGMDDQRTALARLRTRAAKVLEGDSHAASPATIQRVATTLQALSALGTWEPDAPGRLVADRDPPGFDVMMGAAIEALAPRAQPSTPAANVATLATTAPREADDGDELAARRAKRDTGAIERAEKEKAERERANRARVRAAERALLERAVEGMKRAVVQRTADLANAEAEVKVAEATLERAHGKVGDATRALADAEQRVADALAALAEHDDTDAD